MGSVPLNQHERERNAWCDGLRLCPQIRRRFSFRPLKGFNLAGFGEQVKSGVASRVGNPWALLYFLLPISRQLRTYDSGKLARDLTVGATMATMMIPQVRRVERGFAWFRMVRCYCTSYPSPRAGCQSVSNFLFLLKSSAPIDLLRPSVPGTLVNVHARATRSRPSCR